MKVLYLARYGHLGASSRQRGYQYVPYLQQAGLEVVVAPLLPDAYLLDLYAGKKPSWRLILAAYARRLAALYKRRDFDVLWLEYEVFPWLPAWLEAWVLVGGTPCLVDYDDAIFHRYDQHASPWVRRWLGSKIDTVMRSAAMVACGNEYLAARAHTAGARRVEVLPTVIDLARYPARGQPCGRLHDGVPVIGWIGSPATSHYLHAAHQALAELCRGGRARVRLVGARDPRWPDVPYEVLPWTEAGEAAVLDTLDVGIMPLPDTPWERGKCGYKLIQYMACGKPVVASPVCANRQIVQHGVNGFLAQSGEQWVEALAQLRDDAALRQRMGAAGRTLVEQHYCVQVTAPRLTALLRLAAEAKMCAA